MMARTGPRLAAMLVAALLLVPAAPPPAVAKPGDGVVLLESYATKPGEVLLGGQFELRLKLRNAGSKKAQDVLVTLGNGSAAGAGAGAGVGATGEASGGVGGGSPLVVVGAGNTKHFEKLLGKGEETVTFRLQSDPSGTPGLVSVPVTLEYTCNGRQTLSQTVGIVLRRPTRLRVISFDAPEEARVGEAFQVVAEITNSGDAKVNAVGMRLSGKNADLEGGEVFLGNLEPGDGDVLESSVTLSEPGAATLTLTVSWLDEFGETRETTQTVEVTAKDAEDEPGASEAVEKSSGGFLESIAGFFRALFGLGE